MNVVRRRTGVTAQKLSSIFANTAELHVVIVFLLGITHSILHGLLTLRVIFLGLPLDTLFLLKKKATFRPSGSESLQAVCLSLLSPFFNYVTEPKTHTVWAAPLALWCFLHIWIQTNHVIGTRASVTQDDLSPLLAHLAVVLVVCFIAINRCSRIFFS